jgi:hypothetical protein
MWVEHALDPPGVVSGACSSSSIRDFVRGDISKCKKDRSANGTTASVGRAERTTGGALHESLEHLLRYCARPPFPLERLSIRRGEDGRIAHVRYVLPRHKAANWVGPGRGRKSTRPGANGVVKLSPFEFLDRLADLVPPPRKHRHRYHGVFAPNHKLRPAVTALAIGNSGKLRDAATGGHAVGGHAARRDATGDCCDSCDQPYSHDTSRR